MVLPSDLAANRPLLLLLALANFTVGFGAFVVVGVLPPIADGLSVSEATAGQVMGIYALSYAIASPVAVALTGPIDRARVLSIGMGLFGLGAATCALSPAFGWLLAARVLMALGGGLVTPVAAAVALGLVRDAERGRALAVVFGGLTLAQAIGVPFGAWAGYAFGWSAAFWIAAALSAIATLVLLRLPLGLKAPVTTLRTLSDALAKPHLVMAVSFTAVFIGGLYVLYTFLAAFLEARLDLGRDGVSLVLLLYGAGAVAGNWIGGRLTDRIGPERALRRNALIQLVIMSMVTIPPFGTDTFSIVAATILLVCWSVTTWSFMVPQQARLAALDPERAPVLLALNAAAIYLGAAVGALAGGGVLDARLLWGDGYTALGPVGALVCASAVATLWLTKRLRSWPATPNPRPSPPA